MRPGKYPSDDMEDMAGFGITAHRTWWANAAGSAGLFAGHNPKELTFSVMAIVYCMQLYWFLCTHMVLHPVMIAENYIKCH